MRKARHLLATLVTTAALGLALPLPAAQAAGSAVAGAGCDAEYFKYKGDGKVRAYHETDCRILLGADAGDDPNWGDGAGMFQGGDNDSAFSVLNTGTKSTTSRATTAPGATPCGTTSAPTGGSPRAPVPSS